MTVEDVMLKTLRLAQSQLNNYKKLCIVKKCQHKWVVYTVQFVTLEPHERKCGLCGKIQRAKTVWVDA